MPQARINPIKVKDINRPAEVLSPIRLQKLAPLPPPFDQDDPVALLRAECERAGIARPLLVTDTGVRAAGLVDRVFAANPGLQAVIFDATPANPTEAAVRAAADLYRQHACDGLIALGGGSAIDCAKGVAIAATHDGPLVRYATIEGGSPRITDRVAPLIAVPTTAGTGRCRPPASPRSTSKSASISAGCCWRDVSCASGRARNGFAGPPTREWNMSTANG